MKTSKTPVQTCRDCGHKVDRSTSMFVDVTPKEGDLTICVRCGTVHLFKADLTIRKADLADLLSLPKETRDQIDQVHRAMKQLKTEQAGDWNYDYSNQAR